MRLVTIVISLIFSITQFSPASVAFAQSSIGNPNSIAVVIGNRSYEHTDVPDVAFAHNDADRFLDYLLEDLGYQQEDILDLRDATQSQMERAFGNERSHEGMLWRRLAARQGTNITIYYSGHGVPSISGSEALLLPVDADPYLAGINGYPIALLMENLGKLEEAGSVVVYLEACFSGVSHAGPVFNALASPVYIAPEQLDLPGNITIISATSANQVASWDVQAGQGLFTRFLMDGLSGAADLDEDGFVLAAELKQFMDNSVTPFARLNYGRYQEVSIAGSDETILARGLVGHRANQPDQLTEGLQVREQQNAVALETDEIDTTRGAAPNSVPVDSSEVFRDCDQCPRLVTLPRGSFEMGDLNGNGELDEQPTRTVFIDEAIAVGVFEITFDEWQACVEANRCEPVSSDFGWGRSSRPVIGVSWEQAQIYVGWLSEITRHTYRLLSEAEWEYAARAGSVSAFSFGNEITLQDANFGGSYESSESDSGNNNGTRPVGSYPPNEFGLFDMHGNVWEWVEDCWSQDYRSFSEDIPAHEVQNCVRRVVRGGAWNSVAEALRSANRDSSFSTSVRAGNLGLRVARDLASE